ncbi:MAG: aldo/keto reductase [bacterium]
MNKNSPVLNWGIISTGLIADRFVKGAMKSAANKVLAVASRAQQSADKFSVEHDIPQAYGSYEAMLADPDVQAVYIGTPHPMHAEWAIKAANAGKHILVEKPIGLNIHEAMAMGDTARRNDVFLMEAFMCRCHPQMKKLAELVQSGVIGDVRMIHAEFSYFTDAPDDSRFFSHALGGGGILDVGCYPASFARFIAGTAMGKPFANPVELKACGVLGNTGVDAWAGAVAKFENGIIAQMTTGLKVPGGSRARIVGSEGWIDVPEPWLPGFYYSPAVIKITKDYGRTFEEIVIDCDKDIYTLEAEVVSDNIANRQSPTMSWEDSVGNMETLDRWRAELGFVYDQEKPENYLHTITNESLVVREDNRMRYGAIPGLAKQVSRLIIGADHNNTMPHTAIKYDEYFASGGNVFDTSYAYGVPNGACERNLGQWVKNRGIREQVVIIEKGGNAPNDNPAGIISEMDGGLERLQMDYVDIYMMHRDNPAVPVGELVDAMNILKDTSKCTIFGVSNWSLPRLQEAKVYCKRNGKSFFSVLSNQFSLAEMYDTPWPGYLCYSANTPEFRKWLWEEQIPLLPWSSQARGFFTDRAGREIYGSDEMQRCWYSDANFSRRDRAFQLAEKLGVEPINIALAYVLNQPFPTFPLVGPMRYRELWSCLSALEINLTEEQIGWLEKG